MPAPDAAKKSAQWMEAAIMSSVKIGWARQRHLRRSGPPVCPRPSAHKNANDMRGGIS